MAPVTFHLVSISDEPSFTSALRDIPEDDQKPLFVGRCYHWIHKPDLSQDALIGSDPGKHWTHLIVQKAKGPQDLSLHPVLNSFVLSKWTINGNVDEATWLSPYHEAHAQRKTRQASSLPAGWSSADHSSLDSATAPSGVELSVETEGLSLGDKGAERRGVSVKDFTRSFGTRHSGPIVMFNLLAYHSGKRQQYFEYIARFGSSVGKKYDGEGMLLSMPVTEWSSRVEESASVANPESGGSGVWEDTAIVWYPSIWHFAAMLDDPEYAEVDREYKVGVLKCNAVLCCTEIDW